MSARQGLLRFLGTSTCLASAALRRQTLRRRAVTSPVVLVVPYHTRHFTTPPPQTNQSTLLMEKYHAIADATMDELLENLEDLLDREGNPKYEVEYSSGVLTLRLGDKGTYVINKQPPNKQIWLSSPFSGPKRYDYLEETGEWIYSRDGKSMAALLDAELSAAVSSAAMEAMRDRRTEG